MIQIGVIAIGNVQMPIKGKAIELRTFLIGKVKTIVGENIIYRLLIDQHLALTTFHHILGDSNREILYENAWAVATARKMVSEISLKVEKEETDRIPAITIRA